MSWPTDAVELENLQLELAEKKPSSWKVPEQPLVGGCFVCFERGGSAPGAAGDRGWAAAVTMTNNRVVAEAAVRGEAGAPYQPGFLAAREGPLLETALRALDGLPDVLLVNATGRDHPRRAGLALQLGWLLELPTVGVTHRPLIADGQEPGPWKGSRTPLIIEREQVGWWIRTRTHARPLAVSVGWRTDLPTIIEVVEHAIGSHRTPEPIRAARRFARTVRSQDDDEG